MPSTFTSVPLEKFTETFAGYPDLSCDALGAKIVSFSDEFFAEASNLLKQSPSVSMKGQFGPNGALYDGWETRRHNPTCDWVIVKLGPPNGGRLIGFDIDTSHFSGNEAPITKVEGIYSPNKDPVHEDTNWEVILPETPLGPSSQHLFKLNDWSKTYTHVKLYQIPDGGISRLRSYGLISVPSSMGTQALWDLAYVLNGGRVVYSSNQHFGVASNLILPGRGKDMGDGWETKRSRQPGNSDHAIIKLFGAGYLAYAEIDTAHYIGNYPQTCDLDATYSEKDVPDESCEWTNVLKGAKCGPHRRQFFELQHYAKQFTHVKVTMYPDGGIKRVRIHGSSSPVDEAYAKAMTEAASKEANSSQTQGSVSASSDASKQENIEKVVAEGRTFAALPLTREAFNEYGHVIESFGTALQTPAKIVRKTVNDGRAVKVQDLAPVVWTGAKDANPRLSFNVFACEPWTNNHVDIKVMERHNNSSQTFVPMGSGGSKYLVIVAKSTEDGQVDWSTLGAFVASNRQAIQYKAGIWHYPMIALEKQTDFSVLMYETGNDETDCQLVRWDQVQARVAIF